MKTQNTCSKSFGIALRAVLALVALSGCSTAMITVTSTPPQADVFYQAPGGKEKTVIGKTPISMPVAEFKKLVGDAATSGQYFPLTVEKQGFGTETLQIPASKWGTLITSIDVKLKEGDKQKQQEEKTAKAIIEHLFLAQRYALTQQFERANIELDKILVDFPTFARALSMRASIYYAQKNFVESLKWYEEALKADPNMDDAVKMTAKIRALQSGRVPATTSEAGGNGPKK